MIAATINDAYLAPIIAASFVAVMGLMAWIVRTLLKISEIQSGHEVRLDWLERIHAAEQAQRERDKWRP